MALFIKIFKFAFGRSASGEKSAGLSPAIGGGRKLASIPLSAEGKNWKEDTQVSFKSYGAFRTAACLPEKSGSG
jgi:hypothetical protein